MNIETLLPFAPVAPRFDLLGAARSLRVLLRNPDELPEVFTLLEALSGTSPHRLLRRFAQDPNGARLLREQPDLTTLLCDRERLRAMPEGSLGRAYLAFVESEGISAEGIKEASEKGRKSDKDPEPFRYLHQRMRDTHDLWHAATGYKGDVLGEVSLLAFILGQNWHTGIALIVGAALAKGWGTGAGELVRDGFERGRRAAFLAPQDWESLLPLPLEEVRARLRLGAAPEYTPLRSSELRAQGRLH